MDEQRQAYFSEVSLELFDNVRGLFNQIDAQFTGCTPEESVGDQMAAFCVYSWGLFSIYLCRYPDSTSFFFSHLTSKCHQTVNLCTKFSI